MCGLRTFQKKENSLLTHNLSLLPEGVQPHPEYSRGRSATPPGMVLRLSLMVDFHTQKKQQKPKNQNKQLTANKQKIFAM